MKINEILLEDAEDLAHNLAMSGTHTERSGLTLNATIEDEYFIIRARNAAGVCIGLAKFDHYKTQLHAESLKVATNYRGRGIAKLMYDWAKELGFSIERSRCQSAAGKKFWDKNRGPRPPLPTNDASAYDEQLWESTTPGQAWIDKVYSQFPDWPYGQADKVMVWGEGEDQQFAAFKLTPGTGTNTVEIDWIMAGPEQRKGVGSRAIKELQRQAQEDGIRLTLYPWAKGQISQASLTKLYKRHGFKPVAKGAKPMSWEPVNEIGNELRRWNCE